MLLVNCTNCRAQLQLPPGSAAIVCALCHAVTHIAADSRSLLHPPPPPSNPSYYPPQPHHPAPYGYWAPPPSHPPPYAVGSHGGGRKRALICGISYGYSEPDVQLKGCINDAKCIRYLLINRFHFPESQILMLTEEERDPSRIPTGYNIRMAMNWLVEGVRAGDSLVFHYSGHGSQQLDIDGDEADGFDETLCPVDYETNGMILDDEINDRIVRPIPPGAKLTAIIDACHSGTMLDLPFLCRMNRTGEYMWEDHRPRTGKWKGTCGGEVISFSGCDDNQTSADTSVLAKGTSTGAMTYCFIQAIEKGDASSYGSMLNAMRNAIRNTSRNDPIDLGHLGDGLVTSLVTMILEGGSNTYLTQEPQLSANEAFDIYTRPFSL